MKHHRAKAREKPSVPKRQRYAPNERRAHILDAGAIAVFSHGWTTCHRRCAKTGRHSQGRILHHFPPKEDLLDGHRAHFTGEL